MIESPRLKVEVTSTTPEKGNFIFIDLRSKCLVYGRDDYIGEIFIFFSSSPLKALSAYLRHRPNPYTRLSAAQNAVTIYGTLLQANSAVLMPTNAHFQALQCVRQSLRSCAWDEDESRFEIQVRHFMHLPCVYTQKPSQELNVFSPHIRDAVCRYRFFTLLL